MPVLAAGTQPSKVAAKLGVRKANVFRVPGAFGLEGTPIPTAGFGEAIVEVKNSVLEIAVRVA
jgi:hypothetical protein